MLRYLVSTIAAILISSTPALAHRMLLSCTLKADRVIVEVFYDDDTPAQEASVKLGTSEENVIASGKTDERGNWSCPAPRSGTYVVWATSVGHKAKGEIVIPPKKPSSQVSESKLVGEKKAGTENQRSEELTREEQTRTPWVKLAGGLGIIAALLLVFWYVRRRPAQATIRLD